MLFKTYDNKEEGTFIESSGIDLKNRWSVMTPNRMSEKTKSNWKWFTGIWLRKGERTHLHLGYDHVVGRPVIVKTLFYRPDDLKSLDAIERRRQVLREQISILNDINSPLLPEPLDWFETRNTVDGLPDSMKNSEPVLILDFLPGSPLTQTFWKKAMRFSKDPETMDTPRIGRLALKFLRFFRMLDDAGYAYLDFNPQHIIILKNDIPRFVGIGSICGTNADGTLDMNHINASRTSKGYAAPELLNPANNWESAKNAKPNEVAAYSLGVILHQMMIESHEFPAGTLQNGSLLYPNEVTEEQIRNSPLNGETIHNLIAQLCHHDPQQRLTDFDEIERRLHIIARSVFTSFERSNRERERLRQERERREKRRQEELNEKRLREERRKRELEQLIEQQRKEKERKAREEKEKELKLREQLKRELEKKREEKKPGWCFLSTAAYGSATHSNLDTLRWFRDTILRENNYGRAMLANYARTSPKISHLLRGMPIRKRIVRSIIDSTVFTLKKVKRQYENTGKSSGLWTYASVLLYYFAFGLSYVFVLPEKLLGIQTTTSRGEDE